jgi:DNA-binding NarL/FixJ family response regulator
MAAAKGHPLKRIRVLLAGMPPLLRDVLQHVVAAEADMAVVGRLDDDDLLAAARQARADVILVGRGANGERKERAEFARLLRGRPRLKLLAIASNGTTAALYELRPRRIPLGNMSAESLCRAIRGGARSRRNEEKQPPPGGIRKPVSTTR